MKLSNRSKLVLCGFAVLISVAGWVALRHNRCNQRNAALRRQVESLKKDAHEQLKIGTRHPDIVRFFAEHHIPATFGYPLSSGSIQTRGCAPLGCGADTATIAVSVEVDQQGNVTGNPLVTGIYNDCF